MVVSIGKGGSYTSYTNVIAITVSDSDTPTVQIIYKSGEFIHVDTIQSKDITTVTITFVIPQSQGD